MESDSGDVAGAIIPKSISVVDVILQLLQEFINNFFKDHFTSDFHHAKIKDLDLTSLSAHLFLL